MRGVLAISAAVALVATGAAASPPRPDVPVRVSAAEPGLDACGTTGVVAGLRAGGDGFLAVRAGPGTRHRALDRLRNGAPVTICDERGDWLAVVYARGGEDCGVATPATHSAPYAGPCRSGWVHKRWVKPVAG